MGVSAGKGRVTPSGQVGVEQADARARCGGQLRTFSRRFEGRFTTREGVRHLELELISEPCPPCRFKERYRLQQFEFEP